ncbi:MAG: hypothetical protein IJB17_03245 [Oscillospiraceae bacterium]|nr:hypothetical protein [Oscillospiraceae bacterium]
MTKTNLDTVVRHDRHYGIDLLRVVAMYMVVVLHVIGKGGVASAVQEPGLSFGALWFLEVGAYCAVNCYALISGYVGVNGRYGMPV